MSKALRVFDVDFAEIIQTLSRPTTFVNPTVTTYGDICQQQLVMEDTIGGALFYEAIDLSQLTLEGRTFQPLQVILNRPYSVPRGTKLNPNIAVQNEEYFFIWYSNVAYPLSGMSAGDIGTFFQGLRRTGMNTSPTEALETPYEEEQPNLGQLLWASSSAFLPSLDTALTQANGMLPTAVPPAEQVITNSMRRVDSSEWGCMEPVQGPMLHFFRYISNYSQNMGGLPVATPVLQAAGLDTQSWSPVNVKVVCEELDLNSVEYLTTAYNTLMRQTPGGPN